MIDKSKIFSSIPAGLRDPLLVSYDEIVTNFLEHRWEPAELNGGKLCEIAYTIISGALSGSFPSRPSKPSNFVIGCRGLENVPKNPSRLGDHSLRVLLPRMLTALYDIRNNRNVGHVGGEVDPNLLDATAVQGMASWILAELVRIFHEVPIREAQETVNALVERKLSLIWEVESTKRVLNTAIKSKDQVLLFLYQSRGWVSEADLVSWVEYSNLSLFRSKVLVPLHRNRLLEYDKRGLRLKISPMGSHEVERRILQTKAV